MAGIFAQVSAANLKSSLKSWKQILYKNKFENSGFSRSPLALPASVTICRLSSSGVQGQDMKKTALHEFHITKGGKMVEFAGYMMPVQYGSEGIASSHKHTRNHCSIFDVSHMLQTVIYGKAKFRLIESLTVGDINSLQDDTGTLTVFTNDKGGIIDDLIVTKTSKDNLYVVSNAGCRDKDFNLMYSQIKDFKSKGLDVDIEILEDRSLIAIQGPEMQKILQPVVNIDMTKLIFMSSTVAKVCGIPDCRITRCGYTGEDGVEISIPSNTVTYVTEQLLASKEGSVKLAGLGARDSLRLEAGLCLYGNDIDENTTPIEASLAWLISKKRREEANFPGASVILNQLKTKPQKRRVGFVSQGPPARSHTLILNQEGSKVGEITSGCPAPSLGFNVAMGYVETNVSKVGTPLSLEIRKKNIETKVTKMPFVPSSYYSSLKK